MIGRLAGRIEHRGSDHVLLDVRGVGYVVQVSERTLASLPGLGQAAALWTELLVREDALTLVGFPTLYEKEWHRLLMTVQGVGAKAAMAILSTLGADGTARALAMGDWASIKAAPGIGPKTAQRLVMELKDKAPMLMATATNADQAVVPELPPDDLVVEPVAAGAVPPRPEAGAAPQAEALSALSNLGYAPSEAASAIARVAGDIQGASTADLIRSALKLLAPKG